MEVEEILIPFRFNTSAIEKKMVNDGYDEIIDRIVKKCESTIPQSYYSNEPNWKEFTRKAVDIFLEDHKQEIIEVASEKLALRLARTKAAKQVIENINLAEGEE